MLGYHTLADIRGKLVVPESAGGKLEELQFELHYQANSDSVSLGPTTLTITAQVPVSRKGESVKQINAPLFSPDRSRRAED